MKASYDGLKRHLAKKWRDVAGKDNPVCLDEFFDIVIDPDRQEGRGASRKQRYKVIVAGPVIEVYEYEDGVNTGPRVDTSEKFFDPETGEVLRYDQDKRTFVSAVDPITGRAPGYDPEKAKRANARRSKNELRRLILANFHNGNKFVTLTFRDGAVSDVRNVRECNRAFKKFLQRMRRRFGDFKYCRVIEFQDSNGRGAVHYHMIMDIPEYVPYEELAEIWGMGFVGINRIDHVDNVGAYIRKYMVKDFDDPRLAGEKAYTTSKNLIRPVVLYGHDALEVIESYIGDRKAVYQNEYESEYAGLIRYREYNLNREDKPHEQGDVSRASGA